MKKLKESVKKISILLTAAFLILTVSAVPTFAQDYAPFEIFGGYNFVRLGDGGGSYDGSLRSMNGWNVALTGNINPMLGIKAEFAGVYSKDSGTDTLFGSSFSWDVKNSLHTFVVGPQITARTDGVVTPFGHFLAGFGRYGSSWGNKTDLPDYIGGIPVEMDDENSIMGFAMAIGGGVDINMGRNWAIRGQFDYLPWKGDGVTLNSVRLTTGLVYRFGK